MVDDNYDGQRVSAATFLFEVDGLTIGSFMEVSGLKVDINVEDVEEGGENGFVHHLPGRMKWPNISLKRGVTQTDNLFTWLNKSSGEQFASAGNKLTRSTAAITLIGPSGARLRAWEFAAESTSAATEQLEIAHHGFRAKNL